MTSGESVATVAAHAALTDEAEATDASVEGVVVPFMLADRQANSSA